MSIRRIDAQLGVQSLDAQRFMPDVHQLFPELPRPQFQSPPQPRLPRKSESCGLGAGLEPLAKRPKVIEPKVGPLHALHERWSVRLMVGKQPYAQLRLTDVELSLLGAFQKILIGSLYPRELAASLDPPVTEKMARQAFESLVLKSEGLGIFNGSAESRRLTKHAHGATLEVSPLLESAPHWKLADASRHIELHLDADQTQIFQDLWKMAPADSRTAEELAGCDGSNAKKNPVTQLAAHCLRTFRVCVLAQNSEGRWRLSPYARKHLSVTPAKP